MIERVCLASSYSLPGPHVWDSFQWRDSVPSIELCVFYCATQRFQHRNIPPVGRPHTWQVRLCLRRLVAGLSGCVDAPSVFAQRSHGSKFLEKENLPRQSLTGRLCKAG